MKNVKYSICYWYHEYQDMGAKVPTCDYYKNYGECPCEPECKHFITKREVDGIVRNTKWLLQLRRKENRMSVSKWNYEPDKCDGHYCPGDCDLCSIEEEREEDESRSKDTI